MKSALIELLKSIANDLYPLTETSEAWWHMIKKPDGTPLRTELHWRDTPSRIPVRRAVIWWERLTTLADLLESQDSELSESQIAYLRKRLFFGDDSLEGVSFDESLFGDIAPIINLALMEKRPKLREILVPPS